MIITMITTRITLLMRWKWVWDKVFIKKNLSTVEKYSHGLNSISWCSNQRSNHVYVSLLPVFGCWDGNYWRLEPPMMTNLVYLCIPVSCPSSHVSVSWWPSLIILSSDPTWVALSLASKEEFSVFVLQSEKCNISGHITLYFFFTNLLILPIARYNISRVRGGWVVV